MEPIRLNYGRQTLEIAASGAKRMKMLLETPMPEIETIQEEFRRCVEEGAICARPLRELVASEDSVTIVISDMTRFWMRQDIICELLVRYLNETLHVPFQNLAVVVALGTHRKNTPQELKTLASAYVYEHVQVMDHDCDAEDLVDVGTTSFGTRVRVNPLAVGRKLICIGGTVHHVMAGYGGGRKSIVPGIAGRDTIKMNHIHALDPNAPKSDDRVGSGKLLDNPINLDMAEAGAMVHPIFGINICVNSASKHSGLFCGDFDEAWKQSCLFIQKSYGLPIEYEADVVFVSCGGFPKDLNFYQSTKSLFNGVRALKQGGTLVLLAECCEGSGAKDFFDWIEPLKQGRLDESLREEFTIGGYIFYAACEAIRKGRVLLLSSLAPETVADMGVEAYCELDALMEQVDLNGKDVYVIPYGGSVMPQLQKDYTQFISELQ